MTKLLCEEILERPIPTWPRKRFEICKGEFAVSIDLGRVEKTAKLGVSRFCAEISASSAQLEILRSEVSSSSDLHDKFGRIRGGSSGLLGFGEVKILTEVKSEANSQNVADLGKYEGCVRENIKAFLASIETPARFLNDMLKKQTIFSYIAITDHWLTVFWASMGCGMDPIKVREEYLSSFSEQLNARPVRELSDGDLRKLREVTPT